MEISRKTTIFVDDDHRRPHSISNLDEVWELLVGIKERDFFHIKGIGTMQVELKTHTTFPNLAGSGIVESICFWCVSSYYKEEWK